MRKVLIITIPLLTLVFAAVYLGQRGSVPALGEVPTDAEEAQVEEERELALVVEPEVVLQGNPILVTIEGLATSTIRSLTFNGRPLGIVSYKDKPSAFIGIDLRMTPGSYPLVLTLSDGRVVRESIVVREREIAEEPLGIPEKLGGNTPESEKNLINTLVQEGAIISAVPSSNEQLWSGEFRLPVNPPVVVTDTYGYSRLTGASTISHKGTDYRASVGTPVYAMNSGQVRFTDFLRNYGHTVIVDHGHGLHTIYMHLSEINVENGQMVEKGEQIARSGDSGYTLGAHLHLTVRINGVSVDPERFMELF